MWNISCLRVSNRLSPSQRHSAQSDAENPSFWVFFAAAYLTSFGAFSTWALIPHQRKHSADDLNRTHRRRSHHSVSRLSLTDHIIFLSQHTCGDGVFYYMLTRYRGADHSLMVSDVQKPGVCLRLVVCLTAKRVNTCDHTNCRAGVQKARFLSWMADMWRKRDSFWVIPGCVLVMKDCSYMLQCILLRMYVTGGLVQHVLILAPVTHPSGHTQPSRYPLASLDGAFLDSVAMMYKVLRHWE